jgi:hypothetical protein
VIRSLPVKLASMLAKQVLSAMTKCWDSTELLMTVREAVIGFDYCGEADSPKQAPPLLFPQSQPGIKWATGSHSRSSVILASAVDRPCSSSAFCTWLCLRFTMVRSFSWGSGRR